VSLYLIVIVGGGGINIEICHSEYLRIKCASDELIVVGHARYGRMRINRCVSENFGYIGCSDDVTHVLDAHCSGRRACHVRVLDETFSAQAPCHEDLNSYLDVQYECVKGIGYTSHLDSFVGGGRREGGRGY